ncbi:MAG: glycosyltransferase family 25 protein, partial [Acholeplasma sp.]
MNSKKSIPIYLISLPQDVERRAVLKDQFPRYYDQFIHIQAVDGRKLPAQEYFTKTLPFLKKYNRPMTPAEVGCALSHIKALEAFLETDATHALVLEDDIIGSDENIDT